MRLIKRNARKPVVIGRLGSMGWSKPAEGVKTYTVGVKAEDSEDYYTIHITPAEAESLRVWLNTELDTGAR